MSRVYLIAADERFLCAIPAKCASIAPEAAKGGYLG